ncbi:Uncharacterized membrane protein [Raineyella antarctica]|uniref:Uncharacterized membrane protein n=1 Tax=Raineyella antarctica TaxID=1577474 RepID=A0A1G6GR32_9ACTN|nr:DUF1622 domain-containing protein [Raineyella antarctica]SDB84195.1 Uncharacterized membrane protein [Raineyella antarctica]
MVFQDMIESVGKVVDAAGVVAIVLGAVISTLVAGAAMLRRSSPEDVYHRYRQWLGRSILLGLELLVAADIIRTVAVAPTYRSVGVLGVIVLIRTFLSFSLELEITGRWPWQSRRDDGMQPAAAPTGGGYGPGVRPTVEGTQRPIP